MACTLENARAIEDFAAGRLDEHAAEALLIHLDDCPPCSEAFDLAADLVRAFNRIERLGQPPAVRFGTLGLLVSLAALLLLALTLWWPVSREGRLSALASTEPFRHVHSVLRAGGSSPRSEAFQLAMEPYTQSDFTAAEMALSRYVAEESDHAPGHLYLGISRLQVGKTSGAVAPLERAAELGEHLLAERALWYLGNAYLLLGEAEKAHATFTALEERDGDYELNARDMADRIRETLKE